MTSELPDAQGKREQTKTRNRADLLVAARDVFAEVGYDAAAVRDIVARTDLAPGTFYNYFSDKQSVLLALTSEASAEGSRRIREARARATNARELAYFGFRAYFEFIVEERVMFALMRRNAATLRALGVDATGFAEGVRDLRADLDAGMKSGRLPPLPMSYLPEVVTAIAFEVGANMVQSEPPDIEGATRFAAELCLGGLKRLSSVAAPHGARTAPAKRKRRVTRRSRHEEA